MDNRYELLMKISCEVSKAEEEYRLAKFNHSQAKAYIWLNKDWSELGKPTVDVKKAYISKETSDVEEMVIEAEIKYHQMLKEYEVMLEVVKS